MAFFVWLFSQQPCLRVRLRRRAWSRRARRHSLRRAGNKAGGPSWPDIVVFLNIDLVEHHVFLLGIDVRLHLHCNVPRQHGKQQPLLENTRGDGAKWKGCSLNYSRPWAANISQYVVTVVAVFLSSTVNNGTMHTMRECARGTWIYFFIFIVFFCALRTASISLYDNKIHSDSILNSGCTQQEVATGMCAAKPVGVDRFSDSLLSENLCYNRQQLIRNLFSDISREKKKYAWNIKQIKISLERTIPQTIRNL